MTDSHRTIIYCRQSLTRDEEESLSLDFQERECRMLATRQGWTVLEPAILDPDVKGWDPLRPGIAELLRRLEQDRADTVIVYAMSRFARDYILQETIWRQIRERGARLVSVHEPHAEDDLVRGILGVVSQAERRRMGAFLSSAFRERARRGLPHGKTPYGFTKDDHGRLVVDEEARGHVLAIVDRLEAGWSLWRVARWLNQEAVDGRSWEPNVVRNTVRTPAIAGGIKTADVLVWDTHEGIIDRERWEKLVRLLESRRPTRTKGSTSWLEGMISCGCGAPMHLITDRYNFREPVGRFRCSADPSREAFQRPRRFPPCSFRPRSINQQQAEQDVVRHIIGALEVIRDWREVHEELTTRYRSTSSGSNDERRRLQRSLAKQETERERLLVLYRRGTLDVERWELEDAGIAETMSEIRAQLDSLPIAPDVHQIETLSERLDVARAVVLQLVDKDVSQLRRWLYEIDATVQLTEKGVRVRWSPEMQPFFKSHHAIV